MLTDRSFAKLEDKLVKVPLKMTTVG